MILALVIAPQFGSAVASATGDATIRTITVTSGNAQYSSQVTINFATALTASQAQTVTQTIDSQLGVTAIAGSGSTPGGVSTPSTAYYYPISCSSGDNLFVDSDGTFGVRNNCPYNVFNWHFRLSSYWQSVATSLVTETGMGWLRNGNSMPTGARHIEPADYLFHGTLNPVYEGDKIFYTDHFDFTAEIGGTSGVVDGLIHGYLQATA